MRPQQKKAKEQGKFLGALSKGDDVATASGILGKINKIEGDVVTLQVDQKVFLRVTKSSISKEMTEATKSNA
jgi:preprotein translocase subunit YajC